MLRIAFISRASLYDQPGGDTIQIQETANALRREGHEVDILLSGTPLVEDGYDLVHFFNLGRPADLLRYMPLDIPLVISPILVDYSQVEKNHPSPIRRSLFRIFGGNGMEFLKVMGRSLSRSDLFPGWGYILRGHWRSCRYLLASAQAVIPTTEAEAERLKAEFGHIPLSRVIGLGISDLFLNLTPPLVRKGIICVGRIERRKNQLNLIRAVRDLDIPLTIVGPVARNQPDYVAECKKEAGANVQFIGPVKQSDLIPLYLSHQVLAMPSYFETYGLTGIEGLACGCNMVYSEGGDAVEVYSEHAFSCYPDDPKSIREALLKALEIPNEIPGPAFFKEHDWKHVARETLDVYQLVMKRST
ncbi:MAG: glycosyltransferase family 4 protein, partial [Bacteroidota bacterium]|nr:glycosyltransferase family 4 protein [Bacteroidota bacterium]